MCKFRAYENSLRCIVFLGCHLFFWTVTDASCFHPGHRGNEMIVFSGALVNNTYPQGTTATYLCERGMKMSIKVWTCQKDGTWLSLESMSPPKNCSENPSNRCQRPFKEGVAPALRSFIFDQTCFSLHQGINDTMLDNLVDECENESFKKEKYTAKAEFQLRMRNLCSTLAKDQNGETRKLLLAVNTDKSDPSSWQKLKQWFKDFFGKITQPESETPECYYWECPRDTLHAIAKTEKCEVNQNYWICKHRISSCGIPSQKMYSSVKYSGIHIGANATYQCLVGYVSNENPTRICQRDGYWSEKSPLCILVNCGTPDVNENVTYELATENRTTYRSYVKHKCKLQGQKLIGSEYRRCLHNGKWEGRSPTCHPQSVLPSKNDANTNDSLDDNLEEDSLLQLIIGSIAGATLFLIALIWLVFAFLLWRDKRKHV